jgi:Tol biopolymer transport system component
MGTSDIYVLTLEGKAVRRLVDQPGPDRGPHWSPDGSSIVFSSAMGNPKFFHANGRLAVVPADGSYSVHRGRVRRGSNLLGWKRDGVYFFALQKTSTRLFGGPATT